MNLNSLIKEAHNNAIERGFYDCPECQAIGHMMDGEDCPVCHGSKINPNKNIGEFLMLIVSELGEALEAHRNNNFYDKLKSPEYPSSQWSSCFEMEIADVFIRLFDLCGYLNHDLIKDINDCNYSWMKPLNIGKILFSITGTLCRQELGLFYMQLFTLCRKLNIPIEKHIKAKMAYNRTRPRKHGKEY